MITKFKIFENINEKPKIGYYVLLDPKQFSYTGYEEYINNIGLITMIHGSGEIYKIEFENIYKQINVRITKIKYWSENKEELETLIQAKKYNI